MPCQEHLLFPDSPLPLALYMEPPTIPSSAPPPPTPLDLALSVSSEEALDLIRGGGFHALGVLVIHPSEATAQE